MQFEFADKQNPVNYCVRLSTQQQLLEDEEVPQILRSQYIIDEFDKDKLSKIGDRLCNESKVNIMLRSKSFEKDGTTYQVEPFYGTKYKVEEFSDELKKKITEPNRTGQLDLPPQNKLIP